MLKYMLQIKKKGATEVWDQLDESHSLGFQGVMPPHSVINAALKTFVKVYAQVKAEEKVYKREQKLKEERNKKDFLEEAKEATGIDPPMNLSVKSYFTYKDMCVCQFLKESFYESPVQFLESLGAKLIDSSTYKFEGKDSAIMSFGYEFIQAIRNNESLMPNYSIEFEYLGPIFKELVLNFIENILKQFNTSFKHIVRYVKRSTNRSTIIVPLQWEDLFSFDRSWLPSLEELKISNIVNETAYSNFYCINIKTAADEYDFKGITEDAVRKAIAACAGTVEKIVEIYGEQ